MSMSCNVCGAADAESHFGGITCRACAAFFRRYFHSKKSGVSCTCRTRFPSSHPCRECRIQKCLDAGMNPEKVQNKREKHPQKAPKQENDMEIIEVTASSSSSGSQCPSSHSFTPIPFQITSRDKSNISRVVSRWADVQGKRSMLYGKRLDEVTYYETCLATKNDVEIMLSVIEMIFPQLIELSTWDKNSLLRNFYPKWALLVAAIDFERNRAVYEGYCTINDYYGMVIKFYSQSMYENCQMEPNEILRIFEPYLRYFAFDLALPICGKEFNAVEYMAVALMAFFDRAHTNISSECAELCHNVKNIVLRELRGYYVDRNMEEMRFIETIDVLQLMQKGESKFQEELLVCEMNNVHIHDDYRLMIREHNY